MKNGRGAVKKLYLVAGLEKPLLGKPAIEKLAVVQRCDNITAEDAQKKWPKCFKELEELEGESHIRLKSGGKPFALAMPRRIAIPLVKKVKTALDRMLMTGITERIKEPTYW